MQNELVVVAGSDVVGVSLEVESEVVGDVSVVVGSSVMVVIEVSDDGDGHERSGKSSCRFTFAGAPQPVRESPGCLFPASGLVDYCSMKSRARHLNGRGLRQKTEDLHATTTDPGAGPA